MHELPFHGRPGDQITSQRFLFKRRAVKATGVKSSYVGILLVQSGSAVLYEPDQAQCPVQTGAIALFGVGQTFRVDPDRQSGLNICLCQIQPEWIQSLWEGFQKLWSTLPWTNGPLRTLFSSSTNFL